MVAAVDALRLALCFDFVWVLNVGVGVLLHDSVVPFQAPASWQGAHFNQSLASKI